MTKTTFECTFDWGQQRHTVSVDNVMYTEGMLTFVHGFWLDEDLGLVLDTMENHREKQVFWIPPHRIRFIRKIVEETND